MSAVNWPIKVEIVPLSWLVLRNLSISQSTLLSVAYEQTNERIVIVTDKY